MFRQLMIDEKDQNFQCILWRSNPIKSVEVCRLTTVTYGLSRSPFVAICTLLQFASDYENEHPVASDIIRKEMYSDNVLTGEHSIVEANGKQRELVGLFKQAYPNLRKWTSNEAKASDTLPKDMLALDSKTPFVSESSVPVIGISWYPREDCFRFHIDDTQFDESLTKGLALSRIARTFTPTGWLAPVVITAKILMQSLWLLETSWDEIPL